MTVAAPAPCARLDNVSRLFGSFAALRQVSVDLLPGRCYVLIGENGAGKSTLLRILAGLLRPTLGTVQVFGGPNAPDGLDPQQARARIGYMSHAPMLYDELTAAENLRYFARLYAGQPTLSPAEALTQVGLDPDLTRPVGNYSQGMRQRASLARVLMAQPELLLLDEPFSNMDARSVDQMVNLLAGLRQSGLRQSGQDHTGQGHTGLGQSGQDHTGSDQTTRPRTIVLTTHQREHAAPIADWVLTLEAGRVASFEPGRPTL